MKTRGASKRSTRKPRNNRQLVKTIKKVLHTQSELKNLVENFEIAATSSGEIYSMFDGPYDAEQGAGDEQRIGDRIRLHKLTVTIRAVASAGTPDVLRIVIFRWKPNTQPTDEEVMYLPGGSAYYSAMSPLNPKNTQYVILKDMYFQVGTESNIRAYRWKINLRNVVQEFTGDGSTQIKTNGLFVYACSEGTDTNNIKFSVHQSYYDF